MSTLCLLILLSFSLAFLFLIMCFLCILPVYQVAPYAFLMRLVSYLYEKKLYHHFQHHFFFSIMLLLFCGPIICYQSCYFIWMVASSGLGMK